MNFTATSCIFGGSIKRDLITSLDVILLRTYIHVSGKKRPSFPFGLFLRLISAAFIPKNEVFPNRVRSSGFPKKIRQKQKNVVKMYLLQSVTQILTKHFFDIFIFQETFYKSAHKVLHAVLKIWNISWVNGPVLNSKKLWITKLQKWPTHSKWKLLKYRVRYFFSSIFSLFLQGQLSKIIMY